MKAFFFTILLAFGLYQDSGNGSCGIVNTTFKAGEMVTYKAYYTLAGIYVSAGEATFNVNLERLNNKPVYHIVGEGKTYGFYDGFFKVRDRYESFIDTSTLQPYKFIRNISEGSYKKVENVTFNQSTHTAISSDSVVRMPLCTQDVISLVFFARNTNFDKYKVNDKIPFTLYLSDELYNIYIRYMGKETVKTKYGKFKAIKIRPLLIKGSVFEGGEKMTAWISDDANRLPLRVESAISVGSIKIDMMDHRNNRYPFSSMIEVR
ncbi:MAG: DUF3108 domain-containing protein [Williamsia sp.]|nr:DUF3108 domain-containing protein [Williamsia sp.]